MLIEFSKKQSKKTLGTNIALYLIILRLFVNFQLLTILL